MDIELKKFRVYLDTTPLETALIDFLIQLLVEQAKRSKIPKNEILELLHIRWGD